MVCAGTRLWNTCDVVFNWKRLYKDIATIIQVDYIFTSLQYDIQRLFRRSILVWSATRPIEILVSIWEPGKRCPWLILLSNVHFPVPQMRIRNWEDFSLSRYVEKTTKRVQESSNIVSFRPACHSSHKVVDYRSFQGPRLLRSLIERRIIELYELWVTLSFWRFEIWLELS